MNSVSNPACCREGQIVFTYATKDGEVIPEANPIGSLMNIAGDSNRERNILGMIPHPERAMEKILGSDDGIHIFNSMVAHFEKQRVAADKKWKTGRER
jgi:phosphoribosylformylglycinamidine (FGAM) synthase-like amidotransferase family enzyme